jgi:hypothetical protein
VCRARESIPVKLNIFRERNAGSIRVSLNRACDTYSLRVSTILAYALLGVRSQNAYKLGIFYRVNRRYHVY